uniref:Uncharacterized protein n=1 Tax=Oryza meridionalis TaxID=40149 RepID=A0A0E0C5R8_9ORYZ
MTARRRTAPRPAARPSGATALARGRSGCATALSGGGGRRQRGRASPGRRFRRGLPGIGPVPWQRGTAPGNAGDGGEAG